MRNNSTAVTVTGFVVNLAQHTEKRRYMEEQLRAHTAIEWEIINAVDGNCLTSEYPTANHERARQTIGRTLANGEIGCTLSHLEIYRRMVTNDISSAVVLEDDVNILCSEFPRVDFAHYDIVLLGGTVLKKVAHLEAPLDVRPVIVSVLGLSIYGSFGYMISNAGARKMLALFNEIAFPIDSWHLLRKQGLKMGRTVPFVVQVELSFPSSIDPERKQLQGRNA